MLLQITRRVEFDAGHRIVDHLHHCRHLHGHRYVLELTITGALKNQNGAPDNGMIADFGELKSLLNQHLVEVWDHAFLAWEEDRAVLSFLNTLPEHKTVILKNVPTVENLAKEAFQILSPILEGKNLKIARLKLFETPNSWAEVFPQ